MGIFNSIFGKRELIDFQELIRQGVKVIDVRTKGEFRGGHFKKSVNLPLQEIDQWSSKFKEGEQVIVVCKSGARASLAKRKLKKRGVIAHNAMAWENLR